MTFLPVWPYTRDALVSQKRLDPINLVFAGNLSDIAVVRPIILNDLGCKTDKLVSDQFFHEPLTPVISHRQDYNQTDSLFSGLTGRIHTRTYQVFTVDPRVGGRFVASPIHIDKWAWCGDAADSFDLARDWAVTTLRKLGFEAAYLSLATPDVVHQCDGRATPWDGRTAVIAQAAFLSALGLNVAPSP
jgi:hypothetical protein